MVKSYTFNVTMAKSKDILVAAFQNTDFSSVVTSKSADEFKETLLSKAQINYTYQKLYPLIMLFLKEKAGKKGETFQNH